MESQLSQIDQLSAQVDTLKTSNDHLKKEVTRLRQSSETLRKELDTKSKQVHDVRKELISALKMVETQNSELLSLRSEVRIRALQNETLERDLSQVRAAQERLLGEFSRMSMVKAEYRLQAADG